MLLAVAGPKSSGKSTVTSFLQHHHNFKLLNDEFKSINDLLDYIMQQGRWELDWCVEWKHFDNDGLELVRKRPFFVLVYVDAPINLRISRGGDAVIEEDNSNFLSLAKLSTFADIKLLNESNTSLDNWTRHLQTNLRINLLRDRMRPSWDTYFMHLAHLASRRSNCMKRRVGCILVKHFRVIATGYNGTPRGVRNCNQGGCPRCNSNARAGVGLDTCLCLHAEENALLEAGRERISDSKPILYCTTCPCIQCSKRLIQVGVGEVVYAHAYAGPGPGMDTETERLLKEAGVKLRQYTGPEATEWMEGLEEGRQTLISPVVGEQFSSLDVQDPTEEESLRDL